MAISTSPCSRAASDFSRSAHHPDQHDHATSDYDIFVAPANPETLELTANPVRYTFHKATDRYPDVFLADFELGTHVGEAPSPWTSRATRLPGSGLGTSATAPNRRSTSEHTFSGPGEYDVQATREGQALRGRVRVRPAQPPQVQSVNLQGDRDVVVEFDEPIGTPDLRVDAPSGLEVVGRRIDKQRLVLTLAADLKQDATLELTGVCDLAQRPNTMPATKIVVRPTEWPTDRKGLVFAWRTAAVAVSTVDPATGKPGVIKLTRRNAARLDHNYALVLDGGSSVAADADARLLEACRASNALTIEATLTPANVTQEGPARIVTFSSDPSTRNFTLGQTRDKLILRLRTSQTGLNGVNPEVELCSVQANRTYHVAVTYSGGHLLCYVDGAKVLDSPAVQGDFSNWSPHHLLFGDEWNGQRNWSGTLEGVAVFSRAERGGSETRAPGLPAHSRPPTVAHLVVDVELVKLSKVPTMQEISPYREALVVGEYRVKQVVEGELKTQTVRVAHWALLDGAVRTPATRKPGWSGRINPRDL